MSDDTITGPLVTEAQLRRLIQEEARKLVEASARDPRLLTPAEVDAVQVEARRIVLKRLKSQRVTVAEETKDADTIAAHRAEIVEPIRASFAMSDCDIDETSAIQHAKAQVIVAASGLRPTAERYYRALLAVDSNTARRMDITEVDRHLEAAKAIGDLAERELFDRGIDKQDPDYETEYVASLKRLSRRHRGLDLHYHEGA